MDVSLRRWTEEDFPLLAAFNTPEMTAHLGGPETAQQLVDRQARYLRLNDSGEASMFRVDVDGVPAGGIGYWQVDHDGRDAFETGWSTLPRFQGRGVARAALRLLIAAVRRDGRRDLLVAHPGIDNPPSNALCRGAGFVATGEGSEPWRGGTLRFRTWELDLSPLDLSGRMPVLDDRFTGDALDDAVWWPHYTPHWSSRAAAAARWRAGDGLELRIDADTPPWAPEWDGDVRVSHLQTGQHSGTVGTGDGQHRFRDGLVVREEQTDRRLLLVHHGVIEVRLRAIRHPDVLVAFWPIGFEERPDESGEICIAEIFGSEIDDDGGWVGVGVKPQRDPRLREDFEKIRIGGDLTEPHDYAVEWTPGLLRFFVDGRWVKTVAQSIDYPVQLMLDVYELPRPGGVRDLAALPHVLRVERVRVFAR